MILYPILLNLEDAHCVIVGGGEVARRKINHLLEAGARVTVVAPRLNEPIRRWGNDGRVKVHESEYDSRFLAAGTRLVFACTDDPEVNLKVVSDARAHGIPCNSADDPMAGDFHVPSMVRRGNLLLTVSTGGEAPALSREICHRLEQQFGPAWGRFTDFLGELRADWKARGESELIHQRMLEILSSDVFEVLQAHGRQAAQERIAEILRRIDKTEDPNRPKMSKRSRRSA